VLRAWLGMRVMEADSSGWKMRACYAIMQVSEGLHHQPTTSKPSTADIRARCGRRHAAHETDTAGAGVW
jgi:hypothetical protein